MAENEGAPKSRAVLGEAKGNGGAGKPRRQEKGTTVSSKAELPTGGGGDEGDEEHEDSGEVDAWIIDVETRTD